MPQRREDDHGHSQDSARRLAGGIERLRRPLRYALVLLGVAFFVVPDRYVHLGAALLWTTVGLYGLTEAIPGYLRRRYDLGYYRERIVTGWWARFWSGLSALVLCTVFVLGGVGLVALAVGELLR